MICSYELVSTVLEGIEGSNAHKELFIETRYDLSYRRYRLRSYLRRRLHCNEL